MIKLLIGAVAAAIIIVVSFTFIKPLVDEKLNGTASTDTTNTTSFSVSVEGEVSKTGTYALQEGATMADLINAAGGITTNADERTYYETATLTSGMSYYIGSLFDASDICSSSEITKVNINTAEASELQTINGFTSSISESIVNYRISNGTFATLEGILDVYGIGNATYRKVRSFIYLHE